MVNSHPAGICCFVTVVRKDPYRHILCSMSKLIYYQFWKCVTCIRGWWALTAGSGSHWHNALWFFFCVCVCVLMLQAHSLISLQLHPPFLISPTNTSCPPHHCPTPTKKQDYPSLCLSSPAHSRLFIQGSFLFSSGDPRFSILSICLIW